MKNLGMLGKILFCVPFLAFGIMHLMNANQMAGMVPSYFPGGGVWIYITGLAEIAAAISILSGKQTKLATMLLAVLLIIFVLTIHLPGVSNPDTQQMAMASLLKDLGLAGAALMLSANAKE
jgi:uncharacterized membrane protein